MAALACRVPDRKQVWLMVGSGVTLPLFGALCVSGMVGVATLKSGLYRPSLNPTVAMALWSDVRESAILPRMLNAAITTFGALPCVWQSQLP